MDFSSGAFSQELLQHLVNGLTLGLIYGLVALGYTMVYGVLQMINFAHSEVYMMGAFTAFYTVSGLAIRQPGVGPLLFIIAVAAGGCALLGMTIERLAYRPLRKSPKLNILITAIGVSLLLQYGGQLVFGAEPKLFPEVIQDAHLFSIGVVRIQLLDVVILAVSLSCMLALHWLVHSTEAGMAMRAVSTSPPVASLMGINVDRIVSMTFALGSALAGVAAVLVGLKYPKIDPMMGLIIGLKAFVAAVLGGIGSLPGAVLGGVVLGLSEEMVVAYLSSTYRDALAFGLLISVLMFRPNGLLGVVRREKV